jgi:hypothetical protein
MNAAIVCLLIHASSNISLRRIYYHPVRHINWVVRLEGLMNEGIYAFDIHTWILDLVEPWIGSLRREEERPPMICSSSGSSTIYPETLELPSIVNQWSIQYHIVDGRLRYASDSYSFIISASATKGAAKSLVRKRALKSLVAKRQSIVPSRSGEHSSLLMTLRPAFVEGKQALLVRCLISQSTSTIEVDFTGLHLSYMCLDPAEPCEHDLGSSFLPSNDERIINATSVMAPVASGTGAINVTLTQWNPESQFLCCMENVQQLYQGDCCLPCAISQAQRHGYSVIIGGSLSIHRVVLEDQDTSSSTTEHT